MSTCQECGENVKYGEGGWGGDGVHARCRSRRAARRREANKVLSGKPNANKWVGDPLEAK